MTKEELIGNLEYTMKKHENDTVPTFGTNISLMCKDVLEYLKQEPVGHWIKYGSPRLGEQHYKCTLCGYYINFSHWGELYTKEFKYCPNCGSKMQGEELQESAKEKNCSLL